MKINCLFNNLVSSKNLKISPYFDKLLVVSLVVVGYDYLSYNFKIAKRSRNSINIICLIYF
jgi:hypothetical protein